MLRVRSETHGKTGPSPIGETLTDETTLLLVREFVRVTSKGRQVPWHGTFFFVLKKGIREELSVH